MNVQNRQGLIAVTGATGLVGSQVASRLSAAGRQIRRVVRDPGKLHRVAGAEVKVASGYGAFDEMRLALAGVETLFLVPAAEAIDRVEQHVRAVDAAVAAGVRRVVYLSFLGASENATFTLARDHWHTEQHIRRTSLTWTFLRMNLYMDFIPSMVSSDGVIRGPAGEGRVSAILRSDVAASCAAVLDSAGHDGNTYDLTGRESFSLKDAATCLSKDGRVVSFVDETDEQAWDSRRSYGAPDVEMRGWISSYQAIRDGSLQGVSTHVRDLTGSDPVSLRDYLAPSVVTGLRSASCAARDAPARSGRSKSM